MTAVETDAAAMFARLFASCFHGRAERGALSSHKAYPAEGSSETEGGDSTAALPPNRKAPPQDRRKPSAAQASFAPATSIRSDMPKAPRIPKNKTSAKLAGRAKPKYYNAEHDYVSIEEELDRRKNKLKELFNTLRSDQEVASDSSTLGVESITSYTKKLGVNMYNYEIFVLYEVAQVTTVAQFSRDEFADGWAVQVDKNGRPVDVTLEAQKKYIQSRIEDFLRDPALYKQVYRHAFLAGREPQKKAVDKEVAFPYWSELFSPALHPWKTDRVDFLDAWKRFLEDNWKRHVNRDMWNQTLDFADRTMKDDTLSFWSEDQAWPGVIDDFVIWCRETGIVPAVKTETNGMETDE